MNMLNEETKKKLFALRLVTMASTWAEQQSDARMPTMEFDARFGLLVDAEHRARDNRRLSKLLKEAQMRLPSACMEDVEATSDRGLEKSQLAQLGSCKWIAEHQNVLVSGSTGVGKSYLACALGNMACRRGYRVLYRRMPRLLDELSLARAGRHLCQAPGPSKPRGRARGGRLGPGRTERGSAARVAGGDGGPVRLPVGGGDEPAAGGKVARVDR